MSARDSAPWLGMVGLAFWLARYCPEFVSAQEAIETALGEGEANRRMTAALVASGKYASDDGVSAYAL